MRKLLFGVAILVLVWAVVVVPLPLAALEPVPASPVADIVEFDDGLEDPIPEELRFTAVRLRQPTALGAALVLFDEHRELSLLQTLMPPATDRERFEEFQIRLFRESIRTATAMGLDAAGRDVTISGEGARVVDTIPGASADGVLQQEDVITAVDGEPISLASELATVFSRYSVGDQVTVTVRRDGDEQTETLELAPLTANAVEGQIGVGALVATVDLQIDVPVEVRASGAGDIGGPSAGLMLALAVYDAATDASLADGRIIAGTGTIDPSGRVGTVEGIASKVRGAVLAGAEVFLVPEARAEQARDAAPADLEVIPIATLDEAIDALTD